MSSSKHHTDKFEQLEIIYEEETTPQINLDFHSTKLEKPAAPKKKKKTKKDGIDLPLSPHQPEPEGLKPLTFSTPVSDRSARRRDLDTSGQDVRRQTLDIPVPNKQVRNRQTADRHHHNTASPYSRTEHNPDDRDSTPSYRRTRLAAPIQKGGNAALRIAQSILRNLSAILILSIIAVILWHFWRSSTPYGDLAQAMQTFIFPPALTTYLCVAVCIVLYELIALLWTMSKPLLFDEYGSFRADVGRGSGTFIGLFLGSYAAFLLCGHAPDPTGLTVFFEHTDWLELFRGILGGLDVFGSLHNLLFGLCIAGVISCLVRKYSSSL